MAVVAVLAQLAGVLPAAAAMPRVDDLSPAGPALQATAVESAGAPVNTLPARSPKQVAALSGVPARAFGPDDDLVDVEERGDVRLAPAHGCRLPSAANDGAAAPTAVLPRPTGPPHTA